MSAEIIRFPTAPHLELAAAIADWGGRIAPLMDAYLEAQDPTNPAAAVPAVMLRAGPALFCKLLYGPASAYRLPPDVQHLILGLGAGR